MTNANRALNDLTHWAQQTPGGGLEILFSAHNPSWEVINDVEVPVAWQCLAGGDRERYHAHGVTMEDAILRCHNHWQNKLPAPQDALDERRERINLAASKLEAKRC